MDSEELWQEDDAKIEEIVMEYYWDLFTSGNPSDLEELLQVVQPKVTSGMNQSLTKDFTVNEARLALKQMYPLKGPGPDGMPPLFYQHF